MSLHAVLIVAADPLAAALLGAAVEHGGSAPHFPQAGETPRAALLRLRPRLVLVSCDHAEACSEAFVGPALMRGARVVLIRTRTMTPESQAAVDRLGIALVDLSHDPDVVARELAALDDG